MEGICDMGMGEMMLGMLLWGLVGLALLVLAVVAVVWLIRRSDNAGRMQRGQEPPEEILRRRYAAGELDEDEYLRRRAGLRD